MIANFFLDSRKGGPHIYAKILSKNFAHYKFNNFYCRKNNNKKNNLINIRRISKLFYPIEILINIIQILLIKNINKNKIFLSYTIQNIAPVIAGKILNKRTYWFILENPKLYEITIFKLIFFIFKPSIVLINKNLAKILNVKKFNIYCPKINTKFWKNNSNKIIVDNTNMTMVGNINKTKNFLSAIKFLKKINYKINLIIIGNKLDTQENYYNKIKKELSKKNNINIKIYQKKNSIFIKSILKKTDIFFQPSISEGLSIALMEAMSMQCLCLISSSSNISGIIRNEYNGFVFDLNLSSLKKKILRIKKLNKKKILKIKNNARKTIEKIDNKNNFYL